MLISDHNNRSDEEISIIAEISKKTIFIKIPDNGSGISKKYVKKSSSLGMILVRNFTDQLNATIKIDTGKSGTTFHFEIPMMSIES